MAGSLSSTGRHSDPTSPANADQVVEVWGDTVDPRHLALSIAIGSMISLAAFFVASALLTTVVASPDMARTYALLFGLAGCLASGAICARLFPPKREIVERGADPFWQEEVLAQLVAGTGALGSIADLPPSAVRELQELGLYGLFASHDEGGARSDSVLRTEGQTALTTSGHPRPETPRGG